MKISRRPSLSESYSAGDDHELSSMLYGKPEISRQLRSSAWTWRSQPPNTMSAYVSPSTSPIAGVEYTPSPRPSAPPPVHGLKKSRVSNRQWMLPSRRNTTMPPGWFAPGRARGDDDFVGAVAVEVGDRRRRVDGRRDTRSHLHGLRPAREIVARRRVEHAYPTVLVAVRDVGAAVTVDVGDRGRRRAVPARKGVAPRFLSG